MVQFRVRVKVIGGLNVEKVTWGATVRADGSKREAGEMQKVFFSVICEKQIAVCRFDMRKQPQLPTVADGEEFTVVFSTCDIENDVTNINVLCLEKK